MAKKVNKKEEKAKESKAKKNSNPKTKVKKGEKQKKTRDNVKSVSVVAEKMSGMYDTVPKADILELTKDVFKSLKESLLEAKDGDSISVHGLGSFKAVMRNPRKARNPKTGETIDVPAKRTVKFRPSAMLKATMNESLVPNKEKPAKKSSSKKAAKKK